MRLNLFLPFRKGKREDSGRTSASSAYRGTVGVVRRLLEGLGPTWAASPFRRLIQAACLALFLALFFFVSRLDSVEPVPEGTGWPSHYADSFSAWAESFLALDPLLSISTAIAARAWVWSLAWAGGVLLVCLVIPRGFCGYVCPLGTLIDLFDWAVGRRTRRFRIQRRGWWVHLRYYVLVVVLAAAAAGVLLSGFVSAIPVVTRGMLYIFAPFQIGLALGWHLLPPMHAGHYLSIALFLLLFPLGLLAPRFWCRYVCPTGAVFSAANLLRLTERKVEDTCIGCGKCAKVCPFDAIKEDFTTRPADCTFCQTCGGVCPTRSVQFAGRWGGNGARNRLCEAPEGPFRQTVPGTVSPDPPVRETSVSRRGFLGAALTGLAFALGIKPVRGTGLEPRDLPVRPPGSVPEGKFLRMCVGCGECVKVCPTGILQPMAFEQGIEGLWKPHADADRAGCEPSCNACGQVCPTGAIRALTLDEKKATRMGLAAVDEKTCLPHAGRGECRLCVEACTMAGYDAILVSRKPVGEVELDEFGFPVGEVDCLDVPMVVAEKCVGCGLCQSRCHSVNVTERGMLAESAVIVRALLRQGHGGQRPT